MTPDLDPIMQAAERCDALFDSTSVDFDNMPVECIRDLLELAKSYRRILPKGKRPVAVRIDRVCFVGMAETEDVNCFGERPAKPGDPEDSIREVKVYDSGEAGTIEAQHESLERHIRTMAELAGV